MRTKKGMNFLYRRLREVEGRNYNLIFFSLAFSILDMLFQTKYAVVEIGEQKSKFSIQTMRAYKAAYVQLFSSLGYIICHTYNIHLYEYTTYFIPGSKKIWKGR